MMRQTSEFYEFGPFRLDAAEHSLLRDGQPVPLTLKSFEVLLLLLRKDRRLVTKDELMSQVWRDVAVEENTLAQNISALRKALGDGYIETVPRLGYRFTAEARRPTQRPSRWRWWALAAVLAAAAGAAGVWAWLGSSRTQSIAVLPFRALPPGAGDDQLGIGLADGLITRLFGTPRLAVRPTTSVLRFGDSDPLAAGRELGVDLIVDGKIRQGESGPRVTVQVLRVRNGASLWAREFALVEQTHTADEVVSALLRELTGAEPRRRAENLEAFAFYIKGFTVFWREWNARGVEAAIDYFTQAIEKDPANARAHAGLSTCYLLGPWRGGVPHTTENVAKARKAAQRALELDEQLAEGHLAMAMILMRADWNWSGAERAFRRAVELDPNHGIVRTLFSLYLMYMGRAEEAIAETRLAQRLDPRSAVIHGNAAAVLATFGRLDEAIEAGNKSRLLDSTHAIGWWFVVWAYERKGLNDQAMTLALEKSRPEWRAPLREAYQRDGMRGLWRARIELMRPDADPYELACAYGRLGERERTLEWLERAYGATPPLLRMPAIKVQPQFQFLRGDPRYTALLRRMRLAD